MLSLPAFYPSLYSSNFPAHTAKHNKNTLLGPFTIQPA